MTYTKITYLSVIFLTIFLSSCKKEEKVVEKNLHITAYLDSIVQDWEEQDAFVTEFNSLTNSTLDIVQPPHQQYMDKLLLGFTDIAPPDVAEILPEYLSLFISSGYIRPLNDYIEESSYVKTLDSELLRKYATRDGFIYGLPTKDGGGCVTYIRKDWLDNLNLEMPKNWDDFYHILYMFTYGDPDGNGVDDTKGYTDILGGSVDWYNRAVMLDARVEIYNKDGKWVDGFTEPQMINALKRLKNIYDDGLVDTNFLKNTTFTSRNKFFNSDVGVFTYWSNQWAINLSERTKALTDGVAEVVPINPVKGGYYIKRVAPLLVVTKASEYPQEVFTRFIDRQYDKGSVQELFTLGVEGVHWDYVDEKPVFNVNENDPYKASYTRGFVPPISVLNDWDHKMEIDSRIIAAQDTLDRYSRQDAIKFGGPLYSQYYLEIETSLKPEIIKGILQNRYSITEALELYKQRVQELELDGILAELNR